MIEAAGQAIRINRNDMLSSRNWHDMGYLFPVFLDWDADGLRDLVVPNETNRIVWFRNNGKAGKPAFEAARYVNVDGYPDSE